MTARDNAPKSLTRAPDRAVVPAAGLARRLDPVSRVLPKAMFPVGRYPAIEWIVAEAVSSGCTEIAVVVRPGESTIETYLSTYCPEATDRCRLTFLRQCEPRGLGHALLLARDFCQDELFAVLLPDDLVDGPGSPLVKMTALFDEEDGAVCAVAREPDENARRYGSLALRVEGEHVYRLETISERRSCAGEGSRLAGVGRYVLAPSFFDHATALADEPRGDELDDGAILQHMIDSGEPVRCLELEGQRYDISTVTGYVAALQRFGEAKPRWSYP